MEKRIIYIHGKGGTPDEADFYRHIFPQYEVVGVNYKSNTPWEAKREFPEVCKTTFAEHKSIILIANSLGAYLAMSAFNSEQIEKAFFISPVVDMEKLICDMMLQAQITEKELYEKGDILTEFGETLSWKYLCYVRQNPVVWKTHTDILYGENDTLISRNSVQDFLAIRNGTLTVMPNGEHWFHTKEQMSFLKKWIKKLL